MTDRICQALKQGLFYPAAYSKYRRRLSKVLSRMELTSSIIFVSASVEPSTGFIDFFSYAVRKVAVLRAASSRSMRVGRSAMHFSTDSSFWRFTVSVDSRVVIS